MAQSGRAMPEYINGINNVQDLHISRCHSCVAAGSCPVVLRVKQDLPTPGYRIADYPPSAIGLRINFQTKPKTYIGQDVASMPEKQANNQLRDYELRIVDCRLRHPPLGGRNIRNSQFAIRNSQFVIRNQQR